MPRLLLFFCRRYTASVTGKVLLLLLIFSVTLYCLGILQLPGRWRNAGQEIPKGHVRVVNRDLSALGNITISEEAVKGPRPACVFPPLDEHDPEIMKFYQVLPRMTCDSEPDWVVISEGKFIIKDSARKKHGDIQCTAFPVVKKTDFEIKELDPIRDIQNGTRILNDFYRVECTGADGGKYTNHHAGIRYDKTIYDRAKVNTSLGLDIIMVGLDSTSRQAWHRHMPKSSKYFLETLEGIELEGYNIVGDGTPAAIMPILLGKREEELPEARRGHAGAKSVDGFPWIWDKFKIAGYATAWGEDAASIGTFQYRLLGFDNQPTDHYFRYFSIAIDSPQGSQENKPNCLRALPRHVVLFNYMRQMFEVYPDRRKWIFSFMSELSHNDNNLLSKVDDDLLEHLEKMQSKGYLDNALLILMADHGGRFSKVRATAQGKQEERLPYFALRFPPWFHKKHPDIIKNLKINAKRLTTPFDIHETFLEMLNFTGTGVASLKSRAVSLFKEIPIERDCASADVDSHWCACLDWKDEDTHSTPVQKALQAALEAFNRYTSKFRDKCALLSLSQVHSASSLKVNDAVLKLKDTNDGGRGRFGLMTDTTKHSKVLYQVTFLTSPGNGRFEVTVTHNVKDDVYIVDPKDISRTNKYGNAPHCVEKEMPSLRQFCYCKDLVSEIKH